MKKLLIVCLALFFIGCATTNKPYDYSQDDRYPPGKNDDDWVKEEKYCRDKSGKITGVLGLTIFGIANNAGKVNEEYDACMKAYGWYK